MRDQIIYYIALCVGLGCFASVIAISASLYARKGSSKDWLLNRWEEAIYRNLFKKAKIDDVCRRLGIDLLKYRHNCTIADEECLPEILVVDKLSALAILLIGSFFSVLASSIIILVLSAVAAILIAFAPARSIERKAEAKKAIIASELPRFLDMLYSSLLARLPVDQAIEITAKKLRGTVLAEELLTSMVAAKVENMSWQAALELLANKYNIDILSDFVMDITHSYQLGASILTSIERKSRDIKDSTILRMKEKASELTNTILFPILIFKILPLLLILCIPIIIQLQSSGF